MVVKSKVHLSARGLVGTVGAFYWQRLHPSMVHLVHGLKGCWGAPLAYGRGETRDLADPPPSAQFLGGCH